ncbi:MULTISPECIES: 2-dehydropantoate 2-reductase [Alkalimonas]|uniref:2-dehydropantoate 2-reductase n=1 Tax=Alkalimonas mucilaginosa TaxID=3057676 RepID=A0ABU7JF04_9GAMM|nr:2-dehydropantoate 2-reductase [Alkalimonas sp. MEB004]MEE2024272.1 2-dehydropantoate 2-reductase [Alkalimonas sp. MEB004]
MKIAIIGAGAIGGWLAVLVGHHLPQQVQLSVLARGATLQAIRQHGLQLTQAGQLHQVQVRASDNPAELGEQDLVILAVKAQSLMSVAPAVAELMGQHGKVLVAMNGVPWWFFHGADALLAAPLQTVDPDGRIGQLIPAERVIGSVIHASCRTTAPAQIAHVMGQGLILGLPDGQITPQLRQLAALLEQAGLQISLSEQIQRDIWYKLWGNMTMNPISALTHASCDQILADALVRDFSARVMEEARQIGAAIGCSIEQSTEDRFAVTAKLGAFKTSMLQDAEAGRSLELDALVGSVREIGQRLHLATPWTDTLYGLTRLMAKNRGLLCR